MPPLHVNSLIRRQSYSRWNTEKAVTAGNSVGSNDNIYVTTFLLVSSTLATFTRIKKHRVFFIGRIDGTSADHDFRARVRHEESGRRNVDNDNNVQSSPSLLSGLIILGEFTLKAVRASGKQ